MKVLKLITEVSSYLRDQREDYEFVAWTEEDLITYLKLSLAKLYSINKELFVRTVTVDLEAGETLQQLQDSDSEIFFISKLILSGKEIINPRETDSASSRHYFGVTGCTNEVTYSRGPSTFQFELNVVPNEGDTAVVRVAGIPEDFGLDSSVPGGTKYYAYLFNMIVHYAYGRDSTSQYANARSDVFFGVASRELDAAIAGGKVK